MRLRKYHGLGNDYLVLETSRPVSERLVVAACERHRGVGADGLLQPLAFRRDPADGRPVTAYAVRIWNPDGSRAEKSGNGLRILARWLRDHRAAPRRFTVEVRLTEEPGEIVACEVADPAGRGEVTVQMGTARFEPEAVPCTRALLDTPVVVEGTRLRLTAVGTGNPHCVVFLDEPSQLGAAPWRAWGAALEGHPLFPRRTNVQFACLIPAAPEDPPGTTRIAARIWERGAGETLASGSSACAIAAAAMRLGHSGPEVVVAMPGGALSVHVAPDLSLTLRGPVEEVGVIEFAPTWLGDRGL